MVAVSNQHASNMLATRNKRIFLTVPDLDRWQHYKDRRPPWMKLHTEIFDNYDFTNLPDSYKYHLLAIWLLATQVDNKIPFDSQWVSRKICASENVDLQYFLDAGMLEIHPDSEPENDDASGVLAERKQSANAETEAEAEAETDIMSGSTRPAGLEIIDHLNKATGKNFRPVEANLKLIRARLKEHAPVSLIAVIDQQCRQWKGNARMEQYLRPATLFNAEKFNQYVATIHIPPEPTEQEKIDAWIGESDDFSDSIPGECVREH